MSRRIKGAWFEKEVKGKVWQTAGSELWFGEALVSHEGTSALDVLTSYGTSYSEALEGLRAKVEEWRQARRSEWRDAIAKQAAEQISL